MRILFVSPAVRVQQHRTCPSPSHSSDVQACCSLLAARMSLCPILLPAATCFKSDRRFSMRHPLLVGVDTHRKENHLHCLDPSGATLAAFHARNNRPGTEEAAIRLAALLQDGAFD